MPNESNGHLPQSIEERKTKEKIFDLNERIFTFHDRFQG